MAEFSDQRAAWLEDFSLFMALKEVTAEQWLQWPEPIRIREPAAMSDARRDLAEAAGRHKFTQFLFFRQWGDLKRQANERGIQLIGDLPILFQRFGRRLGESGFFLPRRASPAYRGCGSAAGLFQRDRPALGEPALQLGSVKASRIPLVAGPARCDARAGGRCAARSFSRVRGVWEVPASETTAINGRWVAGPGADFSTPSIDTSAGSR